MVRLVTGMTNSMTLRTKIPNKKQNSSIAITDINNQYFRNTIKEFKNSQYLGNKKTQVINEPTEVYLFFYF